MGASGLVVREVAPGRAGAVAVVRVDGDRSQHPPRAMRLASAGS